MFDLHLLHGFWTDMGESYIYGKLKTGRYISRWSFFEKVTTVAMVMKKPSISTDIGPTAMIVGLSTWLIRTNVLAKNQENPPRGFRDRPIATGMATRFRLRLC